MLNPRSLRRAAVSSIFCVCVAYKRHGKIFQAISYGFLAIHLRTYPKMHQSKREMKNNAVLLT